MILTHRGFLFASLLCTAVASLLFLLGLPGGFVLDDVNNIVQNSALHMHSPTLDALLTAVTSPQPGSTTRVIPMLTFALDHYRGGGMDPATFKATSIAIHGLTTVVLCWFLRDLLRLGGTNPTRAGWLALALALGWAIHPLQVSSVLYVVQRMQTLATLFVLLALWAYLRARWAQIQGRPGRTGFLVAGLLWAAALACKEDAVLLPAYMLALEVTMLRFGAADPAVAGRLRQGYGLALAAGTMAYVFLIVPQHWHWENYSIRDFSTPERLLSQGRVLCMYLWQIVVPQPSHMPFYYDWLQPSRGLLQPWTTLPALLLLGGLLALAWRIRHVRPLFALGVFLFLGGHFLSSNVIGLELAFEHRNHFPLIGAVLAVGDLLALAAKRTGMNANVSASACALLLVSLGSATVVRAHSWRSALALAQTSTQLAPDSERAWNSLCIAWFDLGGGAKAGNPHLDKAIAACEQGVRLATNSVASLVNVLAFKTLRGTATDADWDRLQQRLRDVRMTGNTGASLWTMIKMVREGVALDEAHLLEAIDTISSRFGFEPGDYAAIGFFIFDRTGQPDRAYAYFEHAVKTTTDPTLAVSLGDYLRRQGRTQWAARLQAVAQAR